MIAVVEATAGDVLLETIERFIEAARQRSETDFDRRRRSECRYQRSWPLSVFYEDMHLSVALYNASRPGLAFLSTLPIPTDSLIFVQLFCHDPLSPHVPAIVRHSTGTPHGFLVGCEFMIGDDTLCRQAIELAHAASPVV